MINKTNKINTSSELLQNQIGVETVKKSQYSINYVINEKILEK
jgi:hypothetical protein